MRPIKPAFEFSDEYDPEVQAEMAAELGLDSEIASEMADVVGTDEDEMADNDETTEVAPDDSAAA